MSHREYTDDEKIAICSGGLFRDRKDVKQYAEHASKRKHPLLAVPERVADRPTIYEDGER